MTGPRTILCALLHILGLRFGFFFRHRIDIAGNDLDSEIDVVMQTRHVFDDAVFVKHVFGVQLVKNGVEFVLHCIAFVGILEFLMTGQFVELRQPLTADSEVGPLLFREFGLIFQ